MATADIALHSLFILSVLGPARFTYSPLHSPAANRLWTSRLSIMEGSLTVLWQARWIDSSDPLFIFACLASPLLGWVWSLACLNSRSNHPLPPPPQPTQPILVTALNNWHWQSCVFPSSVFQSYLQHDDELWMAAAGKSECSTNWGPQFRHTHIIQFTHIRFTQECCPRSSLLSAIDMINQYTHKPQEQTLSPGNTQLI